MFSAQVSIIKYKIEALADTSIISCFSEYCIRLYEDYDLLYVDTAYKVSDGGTESFESHLAGYLEENIATECNSFFKLSYVDANVDNAVFADDKGYASIKNQISDYAEKKGIHASKQIELNYYIFDKLSHRNEYKSYSSNEYEIEYVITGSFEEIMFLDDPDEAEDPDGEYTKIYKELDDYEYREAISDLLSDTPYSVKFKRLIDVIEINMRTNYSEYFKLCNMLESADVTFYMNGNDKTYEISKSYTLKSS